MEENAQNAWACQGKILGFLDEEVGMDLHFASREKNVKTKNGIYEVSNMNLI